MVSQNMDKSRLVRQDTNPKPDRQTNRQTNTQTDVKLVKSVAIGNRFGPYCTSVLPIDLVPIVPAYNSPSTPPPHPHPHGRRGGGAGVARGRGSLRGAVGGAVRGRCGGSQQEEILQQNGGLSRSQSCSRTEISAGANLAAGR